ncbi:MAG: hypothetical protein V3V93_07295, partial [bacterium]
MLSRGGLIGSLCRLLFTLAALIVLAAPAAAQSTQPPEDKLRATVAKWERAVKENPTDATLRVNLGA